MTSWDGRGPRLRRRGFLALTGAAVLATQAASATSTRAASIVPRLGVTHAQYSLDSWNPTAQIAAGERILAASPLVQNQNIMGWGVLSPEPSPGEYDWSRLDSRMALIAATGGIPVLTLCGAPDWLKGGRAGTTDWNNLTAAPLPAHYEDFANLCATVAARYPQVRHFQVWSELKGFWDEATQTWDYRAYTELYNLVYRAVKAVRPDALIGGPYVVLVNWAPSAGTFRSSELTGAWGMIDQRCLDVLDYWTAYRVGADFVAVDAGTATQDRGLLTDPFTANTLFTAATKWVRDHTGLPVWWSEFYPDHPADWTQASAPLAALTLDAVARAVEGGAQRLLLWSPQADPTLDYAALWTADGATATPTALAGSWSWLAARLDEPDLRITRTPALLAFEASDATLWVNLTATPRTPPGHGTPVAGYDADLRS